MNTIENLLQRADFSKETNHKALLREKLFGNNAIKILDMNDLELVNAAGDLSTTLLGKKDKDEE